MLFILRDLQDALNPNDGLMVDAFGPQQHILGYGFAFGQHTLNGSNLLPEDQEEDMFAHCARMMNSSSEDNLSTGIFPRKLGNTLRFPFCKRGQWQSPHEFALSIQERTAPDFWFLNGLSP